MSYSIFVTGLLDVRKVWKLEIHSHVHMFYNDFMIHPCDRVEVSLISLDNLIFFLNLRGRRFITSFMYLRLYIKRCICLLKEGWSFLLLQDWR